MKRFYIHTITICCVLCFVCLAVFCCKNDSNEPEPDPPLTGYVDKTIEGFTIKVAAKDEKFQITQQTLAKIKSDLETIVPFYSSAQLQVLCKNPIWAEVSIEPVEAARYHPNVQWLIEHGYIPEKAKCVEISNMMNYLDWSSKNQPFMLLHELSHLYHDQALSGGFNNTTILNAYNTAKASGKYNSVRYYNGTDTLKNQKAYAMQNQMEFFAELSEAYFGNNDYEPFTYSELKTFDPAGFALMETIWGKRE